MDNLSNELLLESYQKALELKLNPEFICLIEKEMLRRSLPGQVSNSNKINQ
ncbi:hypothetical protein Pryu01_00611 [Paraliobacillus ryukyuensis]|uniref:Developmental checkpoint coupling sporulation initiation to replication initiation n=1 Tax=Paraliobacillus ryukyuensis TaxID=200904 RepID=A0A366EG69_9BACI|nr:developmental checkpoint coupling sporulation initiation to replication initiation [Paraliobacillus ryukyuensis]